MGGSPRHAGSTRNAGYGRRSRSSPKCAGSMALPWSRRRPTEGVPLVDSHCHLQSDRLIGDVDLVIGAARLAGVERILVPGWNVRSSEVALDLVERFPWLDAAGGIHPHDADKGDDARWGRNR